MYPLPIILISGLFLLHINSGHGAIFLENDKFQDFIVFIKDDVPEDNGQLLQNIKTHLTQMSLSLWTATGAMATHISGVQLGKVIIRIPPTWRQIADSNASVKCNDVAAFITTEKENSFSREPFTKQIGSCGEPGNSTRYPFSFFGSFYNSSILQKGRIMMNEFVKMRYGVFSEKPFRNMLTVFDGKNYILSSCGANLLGSLRTPPGNLLGPSACAIPDNECSFTVDKNQASNFSVMYDPETITNEYFCNDKERPHNHLAKSLQNIKCDGLSVSSVILQHKDFKISRKRSNFQPVTFEIIKGQNRRIVLVIDLSFSMSWILGNVKLAAIEFINNTVENTAEIGLVTFGHFARIDSPLLSVGNVTNKDSLIEIVRSWYPNGWTNIGDGLMKAVEVLGGNPNTNDSVGGMIMLLSDGGNNKERHLYKQRIERVISKGILVNVICYGNMADANLDLLTRGSGGQFLYAATGMAYSELMGKFAVKGACDSATNSSIKILEKKIQIVIVNGNLRESVMNADRYVGNEMTILVTMVIDTSLFNLSIADPYQVEYSYISKIFQQSGTTLSFKIPGKAKEGSYFLIIRSIYGSSQNSSVIYIAINIVISATPDATNTRIINPIGEISTSQIDLVTGNTSVKITVDLSTCGITKYERVSVVLRMVYPTNRDRTFVMWDNGIGPDSVAEDRIFTVELYGKHLTEVGFYTFQASVEIRHNWMPTISRTVDFGTLRVLRIQATQIIDVIPPARIENVSIVLINVTQKLLSLVFLATGDDGLDGNISTYVIALDNERDMMQYKTVTRYTAPLQPISVELNLLYETFDTPFKLYVRGVDESNNAGRWSPVIIYSWQPDKVKNILGRSQ